ncbi:hypothetical protein BGZ96_010866 [Linnemannia gamsii]|uniref:FAD-binding domain-containing protein n=1 Tax=Linnemannia gamsii TaxID=64522 RepID=A0ABQ7JTU9_9FUNG|nr:hypothetical protein BGZ96_010866 [Linnemannia gamsii]
MSATVATPRPHVLIVGAGLGGLLLGALLERCNIPYTIFERASSVKPLGSAMVVAGQLMPIIEQLGLFEQVAAAGKRLHSSLMVKENKEIMLFMNFLPSEELSGYPSYIISRPLLYDLFLSRVPAHKILFGKRVLTIAEEDNKVKIQTSDKVVYEGDILVGADGAYSAVRQQLYERLKKQDKLPKSDQEDLPFTCTCLVGQTVPLDPKDFPQLSDPTHPFVSTIGKDKPYTSSKVAGEQSFRNLDNSEWEAHAAQTMADETRNFPITFGDGSLTLGDLYDKTPRELMSKVMLEEKIFKTWHSGRTVLLGDGALTAMHDAIALANLIYTLPSNTTEEIEKIFKEYQTERIPPTVERHNGSQMMSKLISKSLFGVIAGRLAKYIPQWFWRYYIKRGLLLRPWAGFLKAVENKGPLAAVPTPSTKKARELYSKRTGVQFV